MLDMWENWHPPGPLWLERMGMMPYDDDDDDDGAEQFVYVSDNGGDDQAVAVSRPSTSTVQVGPSLVNANPVSTRIQQVGGGTIMPSGTMAAGGGMTRPAPVVAPRQIMAGQGSSLVRIQSAATALRSVGAMPVAPRISTGSSLSGLGLAVPLLGEVPTPLVIAGGAGLAFLAYKLFSGKKRAKREAPTKVFNFG